MSGLNANGYTETKRLLLGLGDAYINNVFVGNLKGSVVFNNTRTYAYQRAGNNIADQKAEVIGEETILTAEICDFKLSQLRRAFGVNEAVDTTTAKTIRKREVLKLSATTPTSPVEAITEAVAVSSLDRKTLYVSGTDYRLSGSPLDIIRESGAGISDGQFVILEYNFSDTGANSLRVGGETRTPNTFDLKFTHLDSSGKYIQINIFVAVANTEFTIAFNERSSGDYTMHNVSFKGLIDVTKPEGQNVFEIVQEDAAA